MRRLKLLLADDHALMIEAVKLALEKEPDFEIVGSAENGSQVLPLLERTGADMLLLDVRMPGIDGLSCIELVRTRFPRVKIAVLSGADEDETVRAALERGASVFISKSIDTKELPPALRRAVEGAVAEPIGRTARRTNGAVKSAGLTKRELGVLRLLGEGHSNKEIAGSLWLAEQTVKFHLTNIYRKLDVSSRTEAVHWAYTNGLLDVQPAGKL